MNEEQKRECINGFLDYCAGCYINLHKEFIGSRQTLRVSPSEANKLIEDFLKYESTRNKWRKEDQEHKTIQIYEDILDNYGLLAAAHLELKERSAG